MVDVGAHRGESLRLLAHNIRGPFRYVGFEPNPDAYKDLESTAKSLARNDRTTRCFQAAAGPRDGNAILNMTSASAVSGFLKPVPGLVERVPSGDHRLVREIEVSVMSVDSLVQKESLDHIDLLKVDAEGYDLEVLRGAAATLEAAKAGAVMTEVFFVPYRHGQAFFWDIASWMRERRYHFVNLYDTRSTSQGRLYTGNALWLSPAVAAANSFL
jgi:FkbM family methyltransferase